MPAAAIDARQWADDVVDTVHLTSTGVRVVRALAALADADDVIAPGRADLAERAGCERGTVTAITATLITAGWLDRVHAGGRGGPGDRSRFRLRVPRAAGAAVST